MTDEKDGHGKHSGLPDDFPPEVLAQILRHLSCKGLLSVLRVSEKWKGVVDGDFALGAQMFKKANNVHPILSKAAFFPGDKVSEAVIFSENDTGIKLVNLAAANDMATIPAVHTFTMRIQKYLVFLGGEFSYQVDVKDSKGITVIDIFTELAKAGPTENAASRLRGAACQSRTRWETTEWQNDISSTDGQSAKMGINDFSPEVLTTIFLKLSYKSLLAVLEVSVKWDAIIVKDPYLRVQMFKKRSKLYVEPGCREEKGDSRLYSQFAEATRARISHLLHPAVGSASYMLGNGLESVTFYTGTDDDDPVLTELAIANDFLSIPAVTTLKIEINPRFNITVKNTKGIKNLWSFSLLNPASGVNRKIKTRGGMVERWEMLGDHRFWEGLENLMRRGMDLSAMAHLGS
ncbi:hypothetical protein B0H17DRAFT_1129554 [Mycena rosella]|uniref:F-box domain-containing protein n=1 Tax=Mycena rosella TaxID=1033263 RepID=A0AAD7DVU9_MYCRO|nr:hypothetical protein B0H17DRAFT_1129554 [Mycena rosella]